MVFHHPKQNLNGYRIVVWGGEKVLGIDSDDSYPMLGI